MMPKSLLMISGDRSLASGKRGAFYNTLKEFHKYWDRIDIITPSAGSGSREYFENVFLHPSPWPILLQPLWIAWAGAKLHRKHRFSVMTVHEYAPFYNGLGAWFLKIRTGLPYLLEIHHVPGYPKAASYKELIYRWLAQVILASDAALALAVRVVNKNQTPEFLKSCGIPERKIKYIPSMYLERAAIPEGTYQAEYDLLAVARLEPNKNISALIDAVSFLKKDFPDILLRIVGDGPLKRELESLVRQLGLSTNVTFSGWLNSTAEVMAAYKKAKIFVNPSLNEGGPRVLVEAMACGTAVVSTRVGLAEDLIHEGENGLLCGWSARSLVAAIRRFLENDQLRAQCGLNAPDAVAQFDRESSIRAYAEFLQSLSVTKKILIFSNKFDPNDDLMGFFPSWADALADQGCQVTVIAQNVGELKKNSQVSVVSIDKKEHPSKFYRVFKTMAVLIRHRNQYDSILVMMAPVWVIALSPAAALLGKRLYLWYAVWKGDPKLRLAVALADRVFTSVPEAFPFFSRKVKAIGQGINIAHFRDLKQHRHGKILILGRISPVKNIEPILRGIAKIQESDRQCFDALQCDIVGDTPPGQREYRHKMELLSTELGLSGKIHWHGVVPHAGVFEWFNQSQLVINLTAAGSFDKALLEAMASGDLVLTSNPAFRRFFSMQTADRCFISNSEINSNLSKKIIDLLTLSQSEQTVITDELRRIVVENHSLDRWARNIIQLIQ